MKVYFPYISQLFLILVLYFILVLVHFEDFANDPGVGWHLKTGQIIIEDAKIPTEDPFLFSKTPRLWISDQWLSDMFLSYLYELGKFPLIYCIILSSFLFFISALIFPTLLKLNINPILAIIGCIVTVKLASVHFILRPVVFSFFFFTCTLIILIRYHTIKNFSLKELLFLPILLLIWANIHPSFIIGLILLGISIMSICIDKIIFKEEIDSKITNNTIFVFIACFLATLVNPYGFELHKSILFLGKSKYFMTLHSEWLPIQPNDGFGELFFLIFFICLSLIFFFRDKKNLLPTFIYIVFMFFGFQAIKSIRFTPYFGIVSSFVFAGLLKFAIPTINENLSLAHLKFKSLILPLVTIFYLISYTSLTGRIPFYNGEYGPTQKEYPYGSMQKLNALETSKTVSIFTHPNWGGFVTFMSDNRAKPLLDDRNTLVGEEFHKEVMSKYKTPTEAIDYAKNNNIDYVLYQKSDYKKLAERCSLISPTTQGEIVFEDDIGILWKVR